MILTSTEEARTIVSRLQIQIYLNVDPVPSTMDAQYMAVLRSIEKLKCQLDQLNKQKDELRRKSND